MLKQEACPDRERAFICPCTKSYFSYAALFTHIKQKHDGKPPGAIIKPKSENKRGRPRKNPPTESHTSDSRQTQKTGQKGATGVGQLKSGSQLGKNQFDLKSTPGSKFKIYKKDNSNVPTSHELPQEQHFEFELLRDLSRYLEIRALNTVPTVLIDSLQASKYLEDEDNQCSILDSFKSFLSLCKNGLKPQTYSQIFLLLSMILQHIKQSNSWPRSTSLDSRLLNEHIVSFFDYINSYCQRVDLSPYDIFNDLNTIKTLIVFFNWLSKVQSHQALDEVKSQSSE